MDAIEREEALGRLIDLALAEDLGPGDATAAALALDAVAAAGAIRAKQAGVVSGLAVAERVFATVDPAIVWEVVLADGRPVEPGSVVARLRGAAASLLAAERVALNFLQHLSGVATLTARFAAQVAGSGVAILDTRKTTPGQRWLEKEAVLHGGGGNHRQGLYDALMIKENHAVAAGGLGEAIRRARARAVPGIALIVEARDLAEVESALQAGVTRILLDNFTPARARQAAARIQAYNREQPGARGGPIAVEVSGGITLETIADHAQPGIDYISIGALTHSAPALDFSLEFAS